MAVVNFHAQAIGASQLCGDHAAWKGCHDWRSEVARHVCAGMERHATGKWVNAITKTAR